MREKVVLMTGGAGGIGQATAQLFLDEGATVVLVDVNESALEKAKDALTGGEESVHIIQADVTEEEDVKRYVDETVSKFGKIDVFFLTMPVLMDRLKKLPNSRKKRLIKL